MMRKIIAVLLFCAVLPFQGFAALTGAPMVDECPVDIRCASAMLIEMSSGTVIFAENADEMRPVASVTKLMTILLALEALDNGRASLDDMATVSAEASGMGGSQILLDTGEQQTFAALLKTVIVGSANDSAVAIAEYLYGSQELFVSHMNRRADELGMTNTNFVNCTGLPAEGQYTTARDVATMAMEVFAHPLYYEFSTIWLEDFDHGDGRVTQLTNTNKLIRLYESCDGGKTGSTDEAGYCLAATAKRGEMRLIAVVLGSASSSERFDAAADMFAYGFANYRLYPVAENGAPVKGRLPVTGGDDSGVNLVLAGDLTLLLLKGHETSVQLSPNLPESIPAPVAQGVKVGTVDVIVGERTVASLPIITAGSVSATGFRYILGRIISLWTV